VAVNPVATDIGSPQLFQVAEQYWADAIVT